jgi:hypothetical protein
MNEDYTVLRIRTPPPDEVMEERNRRRKQSCFTGCFWTIDRGVKIFCIVAAVSISVFSTIIVWTSLYTKSG